MKNIQGLEVIKRQMEENIETLREFHKLQLEIFENVMKLSDIDKVDAAIEDAFEYFRLSTIYSEIKVADSENFEKLMSLAWKLKVDELEKPLQNENEGKIFDSKSFIEEMEEIGGVEDSPLDYEDYEEYQEQITERELRGGI